MGSEVLLPPINLGEVVAHQQIIAIFADMSKVCNHIHAVINTYCRKMTINPSHAEDLYRFIWSLLRVLALRYSLHLPILMHRD